MSNKEHILYILDIRFPDNSPRRVEVIGKVTIGSDENCDLPIQGYKLAPNHCMLRVTNGVLSIHHLAENGATQIGGQDLIQGRMYILDKGDEINLSEIDIIIRTQVQSDQEQNQLDQTDQSDINSLLELSKDSHIKEEEVEIEKSSDLSLGIPTSKKIIEKEQDLQEFDQSNDIDTVDEELLDNFKTDDTEKSLSFPVADEDSSTDEISFNQNATRSKLSLIFKKFSDVFRPSKKSNEQDISNEEDKDNSSVSINKLLGNKEGSYGVKTTRDIPKEKIPIGKRRKAPDFSKKGLKKSKEAQKVPGFFPRIFSLILTFILSYSLSTFIDYELASSALEKINQVTDNFFKNYLNISLVKIILAFIAIDVSSHLLLGTTLPLFIMGVREDSNFIVSRVKGFLRSIIGFFTTLIPIFDIPLIIRRRGLKEVITLSHLRYKNAWMKYLLIIYAPIGIIVSLTLPITSNLNLLTHPEMITRTIKSSNKKKKSAKQYMIKTSIPEMNINIHGFLPKNLLLSPEVNYKKNQSQFSLRFVNSSTGETLKLTNVQSIKYSKLIGIFKTNNPLFKFLFPRLNAQLSDKNTRVNARKEFSSMIFNLFQSDTASMISTLGHIGPFLYGPLEMKREIMELFQITQNHQLTYFNLKKNKTAYSALYIRNHKIQNINQDKILLFMQDKIVYLKLFYPKSSKKLAKKFPKLILKTMAPMTVKLKKRSKIGKGLTNSFSLLKQLERECKMVAPQLIKNYSTLLDSNQVIRSKVDTKAKSLVESVFKSSLESNIRYLDKLKNSDCHNLQVVKKIINQNISTTTSVPNVEVQNSPQIENEDLNKQ